MTDDAIALLRECRDYLVTNDHEPEFYAFNPACAGCKLRERIDTHLSRPPSADVVGLVEKLQASATTLRVLAGIQPGNFAVVNDLLTAERVMNRAVSALQAQSSRDLAVAETVRDACVKVCRDRQNQYDYDDLQNAFHNGAKAQTVNLEFDIRALDLPALLAKIEEK